MAGFCLPRESASKFIQSLKDGTVDPAKLIEMTSEQRRAFFEKIVGDNAREVNALFESKILLKDQKRGLVSWAKKISGITEATRNDIIARVERMEEVLTPKTEGEFLADLAAKKLGTEVTFEEATHIVEATKALEEAKAKIDPASPNGSPERVEYGLRYVEFQKYIFDLKNSNNKLTFKEWIAQPGEVFNDIAGTTKSVLASLDNSFFGRQGIKTLYTHPTVWADAFIKSWGDIGKELRGIEALDTIRADISSRQNALNGKYNAGGYDLGITAEEAYPSSLPERVPIFGRLYKASESAYNGAGLRTRADLADMLIAKAEEFGVDTLNPDQASGVGLLVNSMTGRGDIGKLNVIGKEINSTIFSIKFLKSNFDTLTGHRLGFGVEAGPARDFVRREAAMNFVKISATVGAVLFTADQLWPGSVDWDTRSSSFGKIKIGKHSFDITGGMGSIVVLASRLTPSYHDGELSFWSKSRSGKYTDLVAGKYGQQTGMDVFINFWEGKLSPIASVARDMYEGQNYDGEKPTVLNETVGLLTPLPIQTFQQLEEPDAARALSLMILEFLGFSVNTQQKR